MVPNNSTKGIHMSFFKKLHRHFFEPSYDLVRQWKKEDKQKRKMMAREPWMCKICPAGEFCPDIDLHLALEQRMK